VFNKVAPEVSQQVVGGAAKNGLSGLEIIIVTLGVMQFTTHQKLDK
jgi:hypothetical protein